MLSIGQDIFDSLSPLGKMGLLLTIFVLFYVDAIVFPTLPELFTIIIFMTKPDWQWGALILLTIAIAEFLGLATLYLVVNKVRIPSRVEDAVRRYRRFLFVTDERVVLVNRLAPMLPFLGAFVAICDWSFWRAAAYNLLGGMLKYGAILALSGTFYDVFSGETATFFSLAMVFLFIGLSVLASYHRKRRMGIEGC